MVAGNHGMDREDMGIEDVSARFGLDERVHRIGTLEIRVAEVARPDDMVREIYPDAVAFHGDAPVWMMTWPASLALAEHLVERADLAGARLLELGCGTAAPGIAACLAGAEVVSTDYDRLALCMARHNSRLNGCENMGVEPIDWFHPVLRGRFDVVVGSEIVYFEKHFPALLAVLARYAEPGGRIVLSDQLRPQMGRFLGLCQRAGWVTRRQRRVVHLAERSHEVRIVEIERGADLRRDP